MTNTNPSKTPDNTERCVRDCYPRGCYALPKDLKPICDCPCHKGCDKLVAPTPATGWREQFDREFGIMKDENAIKAFITRTINTVLSECRAEIEEDKRLVVMQMAETPEGELLEYLTGKRNALTDAAAILTRRLSATSETK